jgi:hypothetical protein
LNQRAAVQGPDEIAGRYQVLQKVGAGAFGTVYKARDRTLDRVVAIKTVHFEGSAASGANRADLLSRFKREAVISAQLKHPNIVTIHDISEFEGMSYLAMEFIDGVGLDRELAAAGRLGVDRAAALGAQIAEALDFAHRHGVVHRDVKPANIMIEPGDRVKVTDFGIARMSNTVDNLTATGSLLGTPAYMSPEQARGEALDGRSDLFSLGCILYEMVAGRKAFAGDSLTAVLLKITTGEPPPLRDIQPAVPDAMVRIVARTLAKSPADRYPSGRDLADDLLALARPGTVPAARTASSAPTVVSQPTRGTTAASLAEDAPTAALAAPAASRPDRRRLGPAAGLLVLLAAGIGTFMLSRSRPDAKRPSASSPSVTAVARAEGPWASLEGIVAQAAYPVGISAQKRVYRVGDTLQVTFDVPSDGYVNVLNVGEGESEAVVLYPNKYHSDNRVSAGRITVPGAADPFTLPAASAQRTLIVVVHTKSRLNGYETGAGEGFLKMLSAPATRSFAVAAAESGTFGAGKVEVLIEK